MISQVSYSSGEAAVVTAKEEDGRIMPYLEKGENMLDGALAKFMGGFTQLKSEITILKESVL